MREQPQQQNKKLSFISSKFFSYEKLLQTRLTRITLLHQVPPPKVSKLMLEEMTDYKL